MSEDVLSQSEVESLLTAMEGGETPFSSSSQIKVKPYDFKRPERVGKEQMRALQSLHESFARNFGASLSTLLRSIVEFKLTSVDQLTYSEFVFGLENPTCFNLLKAEPLEGHLILDINPSVLYPVIDRLLGGGKSSTPVDRRPLTEIELRLVGRITSLFLQNLRRAWENVLALELAVERVESNPQLVQIVPPNEVVVVIGFELAIHETAGMINLCIPFNSIERISGKLSSNTWANYSRAVASAQSRETIRRQLDGALVELVATLAETKITTGDLIGLRVGDIITTNKDLRSLLDLSLSGVVKFRGSPGAFKGQKAIQVEQAVASASPQPSPAKE